MIQLWVKSNRQGHLTTQLVIIALFSNKTNIITLYYTTKTSYTQLTGLKTQNNKRGINLCVQRHWRIDREGFF